MAGFEIWGDDIGQLVDAFTRAEREDAVIGARSDGVVSLLQLLPKERLKGTVFEDLAARNLAFDDLDIRQRVDLMSLAAIGNPYRFYRADGGGYALDEARSDAVVLRLPVDPAGFKIPGLRQEVTIGVGFHDDGARPMQHRAPGQHGGPTFLTRTEAMRYAGFDGDVKRSHRVHVFVVDQGMSESFVNDLGGPGTYAGVVFDGPPPGEGELPLEVRSRYRTLPQWHAHMIVRNILAVAGDNRGLAVPIDKRMLKIYDVPVIPDRVADVLTTAQAVTMQMKEIWKRIQTLPKAEHKIVVNAWGVKNRMREVPVGGVTEDPNHELNVAVNKLAAEQRVTVVFASGNNGAFSPDPEASGLDRGPGRSIWLPAALPKVWNAGACDATGMWIGHASQGPSGWAAAAAESAPDFVMPSYFRETQDAHVANTGSSASCGMLAGLIAAQYRRDVGKDVNKPFARGGARRRGYGGHSARLGSGVAQHKKLTTP